MPRGPPRRGTVHALAGRLAELLGATVLWADDAATFVALDRPDAVADAVPVADAVLGLLPAGCPHQGRPGSRTALTSATATTRAQAAGRVYCATCWSCAVSTTTTRMS